MKAFAEAITAHRIPIPEPAVFSGDPLKYNDWKLSFQTLIDHKNLPAQFFLHKYVSGPAKRAIEGHFLVKKWFTWLPGTCLMIWQSVHSWQVILRQNTVMAPCLLFKVYKF